MNKLLLPISNTGRKYGYITWIKKNDEEVKQFFNNLNTINLLINEGTPIKKRIDWKRRRIGITYSLTRDIPDNVEYYEIIKGSRNNYRLGFK